MKATFEVYAGERDKKYLVITKTALKKLLRPRRARLYLHGPDELGMYRINETRPRKAGA